MYSETHEIQYDVNGNSATLSLAGKPTEQPARELTFMIGLQDPHKSASSVVEVREQTKDSPGLSTAVMLCFYPTYVKGRGEGMSENEDLR